jgi:uncharacterized membrane protein
MNRSRIDYKNQAKQLMQGKYTNVIVIFIIISLIGGVFTAPTAANSMGAGVDAGGSFLSNILNLVTLVLSAAFAYGTAKMFIGVTRDENPDLQNILLSGFKENFVRNLICYFLTTLYTVLWTLLFIIPGIIKAYAYSMNFYLLNKEPELDAQAAITKSKEYTKGYKADLFVLHLSYIGWYILSIFTFGILLLWVVPKVQTATMLYFDEIYAKRNPVVIKEEPAAILE